MNSEEIAALAKAYMGEAAPARPEEETTEAPATTQQTEATPQDYVWTDTDGTVYDWDPVRYGWFPRIDESIYEQYQANYGANFATAESTTTATTATATTTTTTTAASTATAASAADVTANSGGADTKKEEPKKRNVSEWVQLDDDKNPNVYVSGLPKTITIEEFQTFMAKCGVIKDGDGGKRIKLYRNSDGTPKGDGLCTYFQTASVLLALDLLQGAEIAPGYPVQITRAKFEQKGDFVAKRRKKKNAKSGEKKLLGWEEKLDTQIKSRKVASVVVIKNVFHPDEFEEDVAGIQEISEDIRTESERCGKVNSVTVYDRHKEGVVSVRFKEPEDAVKCIKLMNGRWFGGVQLTAAMWDGKTNYKVEETDHDRELRMKNWEKYLENTTAEQERQEAAAAAAAVAQKASETTETTEKTETTE